MRPSCNVAAKVGLPRLDGFKLNGIFKGKHDAYLEDRAGRNADCGRSASPRSGVFVEHRRDSTHGEGR
jgi:hypothetical protein